MPGSLSKAQQGHQDSKSKSQSEETCLPGMGLPQYPCGTRPSAGRDL